MQKQRMLPAAMISIAVLAMAAANLSAEVVRLDDAGTLWCGSTAVFPVGIYSVDAAEIPAVPTASFNTICSPYFAQGTSSGPLYLDAAAAAGFRFIPGFPTEVIKQRNTAYMENYVRAIAGKGSLLVYYLFEEPASANISVADGEFAFQKVKQLDPSHPVMCVDFLYPDMLQYRNCFDVFGFDSYPIGNTRLGTWCARLHEVIAGVAPKPVWLIGQAFSGHDATGADLWAEPTDAEQRCMTYLAILAGAKGVIYYMHGRAGDSYYVKDHPAHWDYLRRLGSELKELSPVLLAPAGTRAVSCDQPGIDLMLKEYENKLFLIAANWSCEGPATGGHFPGKRLENVRISIAGLAGRTAELIGSAGVDSGTRGREVAMASGSFTDSFDPYAVHVYRIVPDVYGCPWNADSLGNLQIGQYAGRKVSWRFRAKHTGTVQQAQIMLVFRAPGYYGGDGGQLLLELQTDDGSPDHVPSGTVLATSLVTDPMLQWNRTFVFDHSAQLEAGKLYHFVFTNPSPDPIHNYVSVDDMYTGRRVRNMQPGVADLDLAVVWKFSGTAAWEVNYAHTPIYSLPYTDGFRQGQGYRDVLSQSGLRPIAGGARVRETFTVSGSSRIVSQVWVRLHKTGSPGDLSVKLEDSAGAAVVSASIPAAGIGTDYSWIGYAFPGNVTLRAGRSYNLELSAPAGDAYEIFPLMDGIAYGFDCPELYADGYFQYDAGAGAGWETLRGVNRRDFDMQFYFVVAARPGDLGDANGDCVTNVLDLVAVRNHLLEDPTADGNAPFDLNGDGKINILDLIFVRNRLGMKCP